MIVVSPLTRAVETCLIATKRFLNLKKVPVVVCYLSLCWITLSVCLTDSPPPSLFLYNQPQTNKHTHTHTHTPQVHPDLREKGRGIPENITRSPKKIAKDIGCMRHFEKIDWSLVHDLNDKDDKTMLRFRQWLASRLEVCCTYSLSYQLSHHSLSNYLNLLTHT